MRCCECEFRNQCDESETVLTAFVRCYKRDRLLEEKKAKTKADRIQVMSDNEKELTAQLRRMSVQTGSLVCLGCEREHNCGILGCALLRQAVETIEKQFCPKHCEWANGSGVCTMPRCIREVLHANAGEQKKD